MSRDRETIGTTNELTPDSLVDKMMGVMYPMQEPWSNGWRPVTIFDEMPFFMLGHIGIESERVCGIALPEQSSELEKDCYVFLSEMNIMSVPVQGLILLVKESEAKKVKELLEWKFMRPFNPIDFSSN